MKLTIKLTIRKKTFAFFALVAISCGDLLVKFDRTVQEEPIWVRKRRIFRRTCKAGIIRGTVAVESHLPAIIELPHLQSEDVRILLADDFEPWRVEVGSFLRSRGFVHIFEACDGLKAVEKALEINPDIAILDLGMPGLNGIQVTDTLRQLSPQSKVIILTQDSDKEVRKAALERGAVAFVLKTHMAADLIPAIRAVLGIRAKGASS